MRCIPPCPVPHCTDGLVMGRDWLFPFAVVPLPVPDLGQVLAVGGDILAVLHQLILHLLNEIGGSVAQLGQTLDCVDDQVEAVDVVLYPHIEGSGDGALLLVAADVQILVAAAVGQLMHQGGIAVEGEDDGLVLGEEGVIVLVSEAVGVLGVGLELHQVHHVDHPDLQVGQVVAQDGDSSQGLQSGGVAAAGHDHVGLTALVIGSPLPDADALGAVLDGLLHGQPLGTGVLGGNHDVDIVPALMQVCAGQQAVGVRRADTGPHPPSCWPHGPKSQGPDGEALWSCCHTLEERI